MRRALILVALLLSGCSKHTASVYSHHIKRDVTWVYRALDEFGSQMEAAQRQMPGGVQIITVTRDPNKSVEISTTAGGDGKKGMRYVIDADPDHAGETNVSVELVPYNVYVKASGAVGFRQMLDAQMAGIETFGHVIGGAAGASQWLGTGDDSSEPSGPTDPSVSDRPTGSTAPSMSTRPSGSTEPSVSTTPDSERRDNDD